MPLPSLSRRETLASLGAVPLASLAASPAEAGFALKSGGDAGSLNALAAAKGRRFGSVMSSYPGRKDGPTIEDKAHAALVARECGVIVPENQLKWQFVRPDAKTFNFKAMDAIVKWAHRNGKAVRGHTLLWHRPQWFPTWLNNYDFGANPRAEAERLLTSHVRTVTKRYQGVIKSYDVVNEAIDHDTNGLMQTSLSKAMAKGQSGAEAVLDLAFHTARDAAPGVELVYNDYMSWEPQHKAHCRDVLRLLEGFRKRNVPVDTLGIQSHIEVFGIDRVTGNGTYAEAEWRRFLDEVVAMGYKLVITEFDVKDKALPGDLAIRDAKIADFTRRYFDVMLSYPQLGDILAWGMVDKYSWLQGFARRDDKLEVRASPYSSDYKAKPMREAIAKSLKGAVQAA